MNFTDMFFEFPVRIVSEYNEDKADREMEEDGERPETPWMSSRKKIPLSEVWNLSWEEYISEQDMWDAIKLEKQADGKGLDSLIVTYKGTAFFCPMSKKKFEASLNNFFESVEEEMPNGRFVNTVVV